MNRCPVHAEPTGTELNAWPCPDECPEFHAELERRIEDVTVHGNYTRITTINGMSMRQTFRNHHPVGDPTPWRIEGES